jgi:hypothetical protein
LSGNGALRAGVARSVITPPLGSPLVGFADRGDATGCHDELTATALVLESGQLTVAIVACDLLYIRGAAELKRAISGATGIPAERVLLTASHTHYAPALDGAAETAAALVPDDKRALVAAYWGNLVHALAGVVEAACRRLTDATLTGCGVLGQPRARPDRRGRSGVPAAHRCDHRLGGGLGLHRHQPQRETPGRHDHPGQQR